MKCAVANCNNANENKSSQCSFFSFPSNKIFLKKWISFCRRKGTFNPKTSVICMNHFQVEDFANNVQYKMGFTSKRLLNRGAIPTIYTAAVTNPERYKRVERRDNRKIVNELLRKQNVTLSFAEPKLKSLEENLRYDPCEDPVIAPETNEILDIPNEDPLAIDGTINDTCEFFPTTLCRLQKEKRIILDGMEILRNQVKSLQMENWRLHQKQKEKSREINALRRAYHFREMRIAGNIRQLKMRVAKAEHKYKNLKAKVKDIFTKEQFIKLKNETNMEDNLGGVISIDQIIKEEEGTDYF